jgi:membrane protein implicated in regulation of membrane protease activity
MAVLKPRTRLYFMFACVQAVMLGSWLLASFAQAKGTLFAIYSIVLMAYYCSYQRKLCTSCPTYKQQQLFASTHLTYPVLLYTHLCARSGTL